MQLWRRLEWRKKSREIHDNGAEGNKYFFGTRRACAQCPHREEEESLREATDGGTLRGCTDGVESVWRCEQRGLEMLPVRGLRDDGAPVRHIGGGGGSGLQCRGRRLGAAAAPRHRRSMARRRCSVLFAVHQWTGERGVVMRHGRKRPSGPPCRRRTMESVPAPRSMLRSGSTRWSCAPGTAMRVSSVAGSGGAASSSSFASGKRFSASSSGSTVGHSKDEAVAAGDGAASARRRRGVTRSGGLGCFGPQMGVGIRWRRSAFGPVTWRGFGQGGLRTACCRGRLLAARTETRDAALLGQSGHSAWRHSR
jgi:hypothetical protein